ncbi:MULTISPECIES: polysaccharide biosynthesis/export family protein [Trichocoleus]|uniref:Polysaccharide export protein n=1 Tax=Trichocoleus desertorum GB2-A4 TaxID=2933944 RepID=A0ABV0JFS0_9CYAN|nr:polysaccharide biosynthesis/export family protein [Trichocoleus sp. FACHB-46]MBD1860066.1 polysaccharide export protein [Trichocoleus sp. FACHB-46]
MMNHTLSSTNNSPKSDLTKPNTQRQLSSTVLIISLSWLLWGLSLFSFLSIAVGQETPKQQSTETPNQTNPPAQNLPEESTPAPPSGENLENLEDSEDGDFSSYRLGPGDAIAVSVSPRGKDLNFNATLDWQGNVSAPLLGILSLNDLTIAQAQAKIRNQLNEYIVNPQVGIVLGTARPVKVMVMGEVAKPGFYALQDPRLPVALVDAGGTTRFADLRAVQVRRNIGSDSAVEQSIDLFTPLKEGSQLPDLRLTDGDVIQIPTLTAAAASYDRELLSKSNLGQPKITVRVLDYSSGVNRLQLENGSDFLDALTGIKPDVQRVNLKKVLLVRFDQKEGKAVSTVINARKTLSGDHSQNPVLEHNDVVVLNRTWIAKLNHTFSQITQPFKDTLGFLLFFDSAGNSVNTVFGSERQENK